MYPNEEQLYKIKTWDYKDIGGLIDYVIALWWMADWGVGWTHRKVKDKWVEDKYYYKLTLSTGGWSGNEDIIGALRQNDWFWVLCFYKHRVGGHFVFRIPANIK